MPSTFVTVTGAPEESVTLISLFDPSSGSTVYRAPRPVWATISRSPSSAAAMPLRLNPSSTVPAGASRARVRALPGFPSRLIGIR